MDKTTKTILIIVGSVRRSQITMSLKDSFLRTVSILGM
jgi:hypothetical protein